ncbi:MAG: hypothetical protein ACREC5_04440, partial [Thermoplasmata archaeon]
MVGFGSPRLLAAFRLVELVALLLAVATGAIVLAGGSAGEVQCGEFPQCLGSPSSVIAFVHTASAAVLLLLVSAALALSIPLRHRDRRLPILAGAAFLTLFSMATLGAAFATGAISEG